MYCTWMPWIKFLSGRTCILLWILYGNMVDFSFIVSLYVSDLPNVTISTVRVLLSFWKGIRYAYKTRIIITNHSRTVRARTVLVREKYKLGVKGGVGVWPGSGGVRV